MFPNLNAEIARANLTKKELSNKVGIPYDTLKYKLSGKSDFKRSEMFLIRDTICPNCTLEYLFKKED